jgi:hypothetical protein
MNFEFDSLSHTKEAVVMPDTTRWEQQYPTKQTGEVSRIDDPQ